MLSFKVLPKPTFGQSTLVSLWRGPAFSRRLAPALRLTSTSAPPQQQSLDGSAKESPPQPDFSVASPGYDCKTDNELRLARYILMMCSSSYFVTYHQQLMKLGRTLLTDRLFAKLVKYTFAAHFTGGENFEEVKAKSQQLKAYGIRPILDYAAEADLDHVKATIDAPLDSTYPSRRVAVISARVYKYEGDETCDLHVDQFIDCIDKSEEQGVSAIKVTALLNPVVLEKVSRVYENLFNVIFPYPVSSLRKAIEKVSLDEFLSHLSRLLPPAVQQHAAGLFKLIDTDKDGYIDQYEWVRFWDERGMTLEYLNMFAPLTSRLSFDDLQQFQTGFSRLAEVAAAAVARDMTLLVDAEQSYFQRAIDSYVRRLQCIYNKKKAFIFHTHQCYLKDSYARLVFDFHCSEKEDYRFGTKLVRGAYMVQERDLAKKQNKPDPIFPDINETHKCYHSCIDYLLPHVRGGARFMVASHNQASVTYAKEQIVKQNVPKEGVYFGQLLGMCDHITYPLGKEGFAAFKYVPFGPTIEVLQYLSRRIQENSSLMGGPNVAVERRLIDEELKRRGVSLWFFS